MSPTRFTRRQVLQIGGASLLATASSPAALGADRRTETDSLLHQIVRI